ncbi:hypothetical protein BLNAU_10214 [Blattamonas nauphoetae]|uniref:Uncharacterized protein n=1 Tax=Blattamonas nauphoetae TaxID=2049346 RepID=A0ABQ9XTS3_9EUKA|nr:hypothetical protein BLNAU_10214 [Blattamonas nauphoetae]
MTSSEEYSPFLTWKEKGKFTADSVSAAFVSLVAMVRDGYQFNEEKLKQASTFFSKIERLNPPRSFFAKLLKTMGKDPAASIPTLLDSIIILLASPHHSIFMHSLSFLHKCLDWCSFPNRLTFLSAKLFSRMLSTPFLRDLSAIDNPSILNDVIWMSVSTIQLSFGTIQSLSTICNTDPETIRDMVLHEVLIPIEPSLVQISRNPHLLSWNDECNATLIFLTRIFEMSPFHQPTLDFICSSRIPMAFQSLLSKVEDVDTNQYIIWKMFENINKWKEDGTETVSRGRRLLQTLEGEGFSEGLEQTLLHDESTKYGGLVRYRSFEFMKYLGLNC